MAVTWVARITFVVLVGATFAAFFVAQRLKSAPPVVELNGVARYFSPNGDGRREVNDFSVRIKSADDVTVEIVDAGGDPVRRLASARPLQAHRPLRLAWDGRTDAGVRARDGLYRVRIGLRREGRSVVVPRAITLDTQPPHPMVTQISPGNIVAPGSGPVRVYVRGVAAHSDTRFTVLRTDLERPREVAAFTRRAGYRRATWDGLVDGRPAPPGVYLVQVSVEDRAGNVGTTPARVEPGAVPGRPGLTVRGIAAQPPLRPVTAGDRAEFFVDARHRAFTWRVGRVGERRPRARGRGKPGQTRLVVRAPGGVSGAYLMQLRSGRFHTSVPFLVQSTTRSTVLVVVPTITWLGADRIDDAPRFDGVPNSLTDGGPVQWPRVLQGTDGLPDGFADRVAPLLVFLDRARIRYDLTSDLDLALSRNPRASDRRGVLLADSERWIPRSLARRLRTYVDDGGQLAAFGAQSLRRGVVLTHNDADSAGRLLRPTQPTPVDPFGARLAPLRRVAAPVTLSLLDGDPSAGLLTGTTGELAGFTTFEESAPGGRVVAGLGQDVSDAERAAAEQAAKPVREPRAALTEVPLGKGLVIRVGLPEWAQRLGQPDVAQVTRNIVDLLRGVTPKVRSTR